MNQPKKLNRSYVALGTNIEPRHTYLLEAMAKLGNKKTIQIRKKSSVYETAPVGYLNQRYFLNMVVELDTFLSPLELLDCCQGIENELGRKRTIRFGPRTIDLDMLTYNDECITTERLHIPHPRLQERAFVLVPLVEIAPELMIEGENEKAETLLQELPENELQGVKKWSSDEP